MSQNVTKISDCPHLLYPLCAAPPSLVEGKPYWNCKDVRQVANGCVMEYPKEKKDG